MRSRTSAALLALLTVLPLVAHAASPSVATLDADARASGNRKDVAEKIGDALFAVEWPAQLMKISANEADDSLVVGVKVSGVKFHEALSKTDFEREVVSVIERIFADDPKVSEVDLWTAVPLSVGKGVIVAGDLATPTTRNVFTASVRRGESDASLSRRVRTGDGVYWDEEWVRTTLKRGS